MRDQILQSLEARGGEADWTDVLRDLPLETDSSAAWLEAGEMEREGLLWIVTRITKIPGKAQAVSVSVLKLRRKNI